MRESDLLAHIELATRELGTAFPHVVAGPGHDCAVVAAGSGECTLLKVDQLVSGIHFRPYPDTPLDLIARKAIARPLSDIAACGGTPRAALVAATLPADFRAAPELFDALSKWSRHWSCPLVGGDTAILPVSGSRAHLTLAVTVLGLPHPARGPLLRVGARAGDAVYVTGSLGGSLDPATGLGRHLTFEPRLDEARWLCDTLGEHLHAMMDISDGLGRDAARLAAASGVRMALEAARLPLSAGITQWRRAAADGEDYELLFTAPADAALPPQCPRTGTLITRIGTATQGRGCTIRDPSGIEVNASDLGWDSAGA
jgi:thiamine-monophosphate kinase